MLKCTAVLYFDHACLLESADSDVSVSQSSTRSIFFQSGKRTRGASATPGHTTPGPRTTILSRATWRAAYAASAGALHASACRAPLGTSGARHVPLCRRRRACRWFFARRDLSSFPTCRLRRGARERVRHMSLAPTFKVRPPSRVLAATPRPTRATWHDRPILALRFAEELSDAS